MTDNITLIMPVKNPHPAYIRDSMRSVREQTDQSWEMIVVCNSQDDLVLAKNAWDSPRIKWVCAPNTCSGGAINIGMRAAETSFVAAILCDDMLTPSAIATMRLYIKAFPDIDLFHSSRTIVDDDGKHLATCWSKIADKSSDFLEGNAKHMLCWRRQAAIDMGGLEENMHGGDDYDFPWSMFDAGYEFKPVMECLYIYRDHRSHPRLTTHVPLNRQEDDLRKVLKKHGMNPTQIDVEVEIRKSGYLKQALFLNDKSKEDNIIDPKRGWRETGIETFGERKDYNDSPKKKYCICSIPRSGSTLLCEALSNTELAGYPKEYLHKDIVNKEINKQWIASLFSKTTSNGVFGIKIFYSQIQCFLQAVQKNIDEYQGVDNDTAMMTTFQDAYFIFLTRADKLAQAVSLARAKQTSSWSSLSPQKRDPVFSALVIDECISEILEEEKCWKNMFERYQIRPLMMEYQEVASAPLDAARKVISFIGIMDEPVLKFQIKMKKQADDTSALWMKMYRQERPDCPY